MSIDPDAPAAARPAAPATPGAPEAIRLTEFTHGGGCGCKLAPGVLARLLASAPRGVLPPELLVGIETSDDAAVYLLNPDQALVATTDFFTPIVDDPTDFGRIAACNAISDVYAMGASPILALSLLGMPIARLPEDAIARVLAGGAAVCAAAGIPIAGGHSIDLIEPVYGLVVLGLAHPDRIRRNADAQAGDAIVLGKPLGVGILSAALKKRRLPASGYARMVGLATQLNRVGPDLAALAGVHALTDVTGFGLAGHLLEVCRGAGLDASIGLERLPVVDEARALAREGTATGASARNWASYGADVELPPGLPPWQQAIVTDPQTSGGLLVTCAVHAVDEVLEVFRAGGFAQAAWIGTMHARGSPGQAARLRCSGTLS